MKRNRLGTVLRLRSITERRARSRLNVSDREVERTRHEVERLRNRETPRPVHEVLSPLQLRVLALQGVRSHELLTEAAAEHERSLLRRAEAHHEWSQASIEHKSTERLDERRQTEAANHARQAAERVLDELVVLRRGRSR